MKLILENALWPISCSSCDSQHFYHTYFIERCQYSCILAMIRSNMEYVADDLACRLIFQGSNKNRTTQGEDTAIILLQWARSIAK